LIKDAGEEITPLRVPTEDEFKYYYSEENFESKCCYYFNEFLVFIFKLICFFSILGFLGCIGVIHFATYRTLLGEPFQTAGSNEATVFFVILITMFMYYTNGV
jgi:hypothetical protein